VSIPVGSVGCAVMDTFILYIFMAISVSISFLSALLHWHSGNSDEHGWLNSLFGWGQTAWSHLLLVASFVTGWYAISITFSVFNKWLMNEYHGGFKYPISITCVHMTVKYILAKSVFACGISKTVVEPISSWKTLVVVVLIGVCTAFDIALSNESVMLVTLTLYTTMKSKVLVFTYFWALALRLEVFEWKIFGAIWLVSFGVSLSVSAATDVNYRGILCVLGAACFGGLRWALCQYLVTADKQSKEDVFVAILRFAPYSALAMYPVTLLMEDLPKLVESTSEHQLLDDAGLALFGGFIAFLLIIVEIKLVKIVSSVSMGVFGQLKEVTQIILSMLVFHDHLSINGAVGICIALVGAQCYKTVRSGHGSGSTSTEEENRKEGLLRSSEGISLISVPTSPMLVGASPKNHHKKTGPLSPRQRDKSRDRRREGQALTEHTEAELDLLLPSPESNQETIV
jgi:solute carrier family 35 protein C2